VKLLLDTHILLWAASDPQRISEGTQALLLDPANKLFFSVVSLWEIVIKRGLGRDDFSVDPHRLRRLLVANGYTELSVLAEHVLHVDRLPTLHKDPFDRLLIAQAQTEAMLLVTVDGMVMQYNDAVLAAS
jgi:PIN domain nuclease of toxin-antitoxin system